MARKTIPDSTQATVLLKSRRRCCLCFWLKGDDEVKKGQIAHLDDDNENAAEDNLVFLCLEHHDEYDSTPRLSKGLREQEVKRWRDELYKEMEYRFKTRGPGPLTVQFDQARNCFWEVERICAIYRIVVRNEGTTTVKNVGVKIVDITASEQTTDAEMRRFRGLRLCLSMNPFGGYSHPDTIPDSTLVLHPKDEAIFDFARLCAVPGNFLICHSGFFLNAQTSRLDQRPNGFFPAGTYEVKLSAQGDDVNPVSHCFHLTATTTDVALHWSQRTE